MNFLLNHINPVTRKRLHRFRQMRRGFWSLIILLTLLLLSLGSELLCNNRPLYLRFNGKSYFPVFKHYPESLFTGSDRDTAPNYKQLAATAAFADNAQNYMIFAPIPYGPNESVDPNSIGLPDTVSVIAEPRPRVGSVNITADLSVVQSVASYRLFELADDQQVRGRKLDADWLLPTDLLQAIEQRFANQNAAEFSREVTHAASGRTATMILPQYSRRATPPPTVRLRIQQPDPTAPTYRMVFARDNTLASDPHGLWPRLSQSLQQQLRANIDQRRQAIVPPLNLPFNNRDYSFRFQKEDVIFPFRPTANHWLGLDNAGRDVLVRIIYGLRTSLVFGLILVLGSISVGTIFGAIQGYFGGKIDIISQRVIEIWSALPFLYVIILLGSVYGRSLTLLLVVYGMFNWIGMSYYMRAEFLRLRTQTYVEAAKCLGLSAPRIIFKHILPNALVPVITFFPFSLVGAIGSLAALDYLGFGLPPPTPSWGELLHQAQQYRWAWWLILYPSLALFVVMLLGVFFGEGVRHAFDPRRHSRLE